MWLKLFAWRIKSVKTLVANGALKSIAAKMLTKECIDDR